jgi:hypothetical protein
MAKHSSPRTTKLYGRRKDRITQIEWATGLLSNSLPMVVLA